MVATTSHNQPSPQGKSSLFPPLRDVVTSLFRRRWIVLTIASPIILAGVLALIGQRETYVATARVLVELTSADRPRWNTSARNLNYDLEMRTLSNIAMSVPVIEAAAKSLADSIAVIRGLDPVFAGIGAGDLKYIILVSTSVGIVDKSRILEFRHGSLYPRLAVMVAGAMRDAFVKYHIYDRKNVQAINYYNEQIAVVRAQVDTLLAQRAAVLEQAGYSDLRNELRVESRTLSDVEFRLVKARSARRAAEISYNVLLAALDDDPRDFPMGTNESRSFALAAWRRVVGRNENELIVVKNVFAPDSAPVRRKTEMLEAALESLRREEEAFVRSAGMALDGLRAAERTLAKLVSDREARRGEAPRAYYKAALLDAEITSLREVMESLQNKIGEVRIAHQADERVSSLISLTQPEIAPALTGGKSFVYFVVLCVFAVALGIVAAFALEGLDHRVSSVKEIEEYLRLPVFASISQAKWRERATAKGEG